jgi:hypothetical protein
MKQFGAERPGRLFQVQVWTSTVGKISKERKQEARELLLEARDHFRAFVTSEVDKNKPQGPDPATAENSG